MPDGLGKMALSAPGWTDKKSIFASAYEGGSRQIEDKSTVHLGIELEVKRIECLVGVAETRLLVSPLQQSLAAAG